jgi:BspA type Leucine rich repeat region (6 copies)
MKKLLTIGLTLLLGATLLSGCGQNNGETTATTSGEAGVSQSASETGTDAAISDDIFEWDGTVITGLTEKGKEQESIVIPDTATSIERAAFRNDDFKSVVIGASVKEIGDSAFWQCNELESISFPSSVEKIGKRAFYLCGSLKTITFSEGLLEIGEEAFSTTSCETITLPEGLVTIGENAFSPCANTNHVYIPASAESIPMGAFGVSSVAKIYVKEGSWADLNFESFVPANIDNPEISQYEKAYY